MHPLGETLARIDGRVHGAQLGAPDGWLSPADLVGDPDVFASALAIATAAYDTARRDILGNRLLEIWAWLVATPAAMTLLLERRLPDIGAANVTVDPGLWSDPAPIALRTGRFWCLPGDSAAEHADAVVVADERALALQYAETLREHHLGPLVEHIAGWSRRGRRALWRGATDQLVGALTGAGSATDREDDALALARLTGARVEVRRFELDGLPAHTMHLREGCCLYYRVDGRPPNCSNCPLIDDERRVELLAAELRAS